MTQMTATDRRDIINHINMFGPAAVCKKMGRKWFVSFRDFGFPSAYGTKMEAMRVASQWVCALAHPQA